MNVPLEDSWSSVPERTENAYLDSVRLKDKLFFYSIVSSMEIRQIWWFDVTKDKEVLTLSQSEITS